MSSAATVPFASTREADLSAAANTYPSVWRRTETRKDAETARRSRIWPETYTQTLFMTDEDTEAEFESLFRAAREVEFEDGMENDFSRQLSTLVRKSGPMSKDILARLFEDRTISREVLSEALRWIGRMDDQPTYVSRLWLLEKALGSPSHSVRDGAVLGLASMEDPHAIRYLETAMVNEVVPQLRNDMREVVDQLKNEH